MASKSAQADCSEVPYFSHTHHTADVSWAQALVNTIAGSLCYLCLYPDSELNIRDLMQSVAWEQGDPNHLLWPACPERPCPRTCSRGSSMSRGASRAQMGNARFWAMPCPGPLPSPGRRPSPGQPGLLSQAYHSPGRRIHATLLCTMRHPCSFR